MTQGEFHTVLGQKETNEAPRSLGRRRKAFYFFMVLLFAGSYLTYRETSPPIEFRAKSLVNIPSGYSLGEIGTLLEKNSIIRSALLFDIAIAHLGRERDIPSGMYLFEEPMSVLAVAKKMGSGERGIETKRVTLPEGLTNVQMSNVLSTELPNFTAQDFLALTKTKEGYLFPDTYFFLSTATSGEVYDVLSDNFLKRTAALFEENTQLNHSWEDIIIMASLLEEEAQTSVDKRIVSQILWKRLAVGMRLGVDAPFVYLLGKGSLELTQSDLTLDSPYNTYRYAGLPPTPIANPGLDSIEAAMHPATTSYLYYLSDKKRVMHYSKTFDEHKLNKTKYLY